MEFQPFITNIGMRLQEVGKIKIGKKGKETTSASGASFRAPQKLDHFIVTKTSRDKNDDFELDVPLMQKLGEKPTEIPVRLLYDDVHLNFRSRYCCFDGKKLWCHGDGLHAERLVDGKKAEVSCPCEKCDPAYLGEDKYGKKKCKVTGALSVIIEGADRVAGVWVFRTTSYNSVQNIYASLMLITRLTGGVLCGLPLYMTLSMKVTQNPVDGSQVRIYVVGIEYRGSMEQLRVEGHQIALANASQSVKIERIEQEARRLIAQDIEIIDDEEDHADEFHPEDAAEDLPVSSSAPELAQPTQVQPEQPQPTEAAPKAKRGRKSIQEPPQPVDLGEPVEETPVTPSAPVQAPPAAPAPARSTGTFFD
jgi:hypothetical protein